MSIDQISIILLAAGASVRLGKPKQLLRFRGETLLGRSAKIALAVSNQVVVVLGANIDIMQPEIQDLPVMVAENKDWKNGMSSSIKCGLEKLLSTSVNLQAIIVMVCDQPLADEKLFRKIIAEYKKSNALIVACQYENTLGVPALFRKNLFSELLALEAQIGAKQLIKKYQAQTATISFPGGAFDIDTQADYENLVGS